MLLVVHILLVLAGYAALFFTALSAVGYLMQERRLKSKSASALLERLPPLATLDTMLTKSLGLGFAFLTLGLIFAVMWAFLYSNSSWIGNPSITLSVFTWILLVIMLFLRQSAGWRGRKAAMMALAVLGMQRADVGDAFGIGEHAGSMKFLLTGLNHRTAPVEVRERIAFDEGALPEALEKLKKRPGVQEGVILSTCNRVEVSVTADDGADADAAVAGFSGRCAECGSVAGDTVPLSLRRVGGDPAFVSRRIKLGLHGGGRAADSGPAQVGVRGGEG